MQVDAESLNSLAKQMGDSGWWVSPMRIGETPVFLAEKVCDRDGGTSAWELVTCLVVASLPQEEASGEAIKHDAKTREARLLILAEMESPEALLAAAAQARSTTR